MTATITRLLLGRLLSNRESEQRKIGAFEGVPAMGLDGLASSAYGPEAALTILIPLGAASLHAIGFVIVPIVLLLVLLYFSYRQTIRAYPSNGGAYVVAKSNLGQGAGLLAAAALMIDYVLNVAVGISAGIAALVSAIPDLHPYILVLCLGTLAVITLMNLRGTQDAGRLWAAPTYLFIASFLALLAIGTWRSLAAGGAPEPVVAPPPLGPTVEAASLWLLLRAFASGCTAMTGVEAVSNGVGAFREPSVRHAHRTLTAIVGVLGLLLAGISYLASAYHIGAMDQQQAGYRSVLSQLAAAVVGNGWFYYVALGSLFCVLALSANTSFVDFPRLCRLVAADAFLPKPFAVAGRRLVFSVGVLYLAVSAALLLVAFGGITDRLIPLFAVGAFLTFTLSQSGMVVHWLRALRTEADPRRRRAQRLKLAINALGASATLVALAVIVVAKFVDGAWMTVLIIPAVILLLRAIHRYYEALERDLASAAPLSIRQLDAPIVLVTVEYWSRLTAKALQFALSISSDVLAVHVLEVAGPEAEERHENLRQIWSRDVEGPAAAAGLRRPRLLQLQAPFRRMQGPVLKLIERVEAEFPGRTIAVLIPELVKVRWWQYPLHTHRGHDLRDALLRYGGPQLTVIHVPWHVDQPDRREALEPEERPAPASGTPG